MNKVVILGDSVWPPSKSYPSLFDSILVLEKVPPAVPLFNQTVYYFTVVFNGGKFLQYFRNPVIKRGNKKKSLNFLIEK